MRKKMLIKFTRKDCNAGNCWAYSALRETAGFYLGKCNVKVVSWLALLSTLT
jgi:hypothetical protein